jgi:class 3 adenylate cyclase
MSWDEQKAKDRVADHSFSDLEVDVVELSREMDFHNLGTKEVRRVKGAHLYADVPNFHDAVANAGGDNQRIRKLVRAASVLRRVQDDLLKELDVGRLQLQAARLHSLVYKPYDDEVGRATQAILLAITLNSYVYSAFNDVFGEIWNFESAVGIASGESLIANLGFHGDRELISLGSCANLGAKVINGMDTISITEEIYLLLPKELNAFFLKAAIVEGVTAYRATSLRWSNQPKLAEDFGVEFNTDKLKKKTEQYRDALPLHEMEISDAEVIIDLEQLTERNSKKVSAVALYADLDGFTRYVQSAEEDEAIISLVRILHMIRSEFHAVVEQDYPGLVLQHQGDRIFAIVHMPSGDSFEKRCANGLDVAIGIQSSMEHVLKNHLGDRKGIHVAVGIDVGSALVTRLGRKGEREVVCLGPRVTSAEHLQLRSQGQEIRTSKKIYETITSEPLKRQFLEDDQEAYVAKGLTFPKLDEIEATEAAKAGLLGTAATDRGVRIEITDHRRRESVSTQRAWYSK